MRRSRRIEKEEEKRKNDEVETQWSLKRIVFFLTILGVLLFLIYYVIQSRVGQVLGEKDMNNSADGPQISVPKKENIEDIIEDAEKSISNIDANDVVSSQPQIQNAIEQLEKLTNKDNFKENFCSSICGN